MQRLDLVSIVFRLHPEDREELRALCARTRVRQSEYLREAVAWLVRQEELVPTGRQSTRGWLNTHVLLAREQAVALRSMSAHRRVNQSVLLDQAVSALLAKYRAPSFAQQAGADTRYARTTVLTAQAGANPDRGEGAL